eukprot:GHVT01031485.1.p1 GENE.GHVT01031485.1~~GHVT01031485.1.p1  ORF type:complete len:149 (-),score=31.11 GHVT01031485.1:523-969(-)
MAAKGCSRRADRHRLTMAAALLVLSGIARPVSFPCLATCLHLPCVPCGPWHTCAGRPATVSASRATRRPSDSLRSSGRSRRRARPGGAAEGAARLSKPRPARVVSSDDDESQDSPSALRRPRNARPGKRRRLTLLSASSDDDDGDDDE